jgi:hypothetical protein
MSKRDESALQRIPREIWWMILDEILDEIITLISATSYEGNDWPEDSQLDTCNGFGGIMYKIWKERVEELGSVCRTWQAFAGSRRYRVFDLDRVIPPDWPLEMKRLLAKARFVLLDPKFRHQFRLNMLPDHENTVEWEALLISVPEAVSFAQTVSHPRLRRLNVVYRDWDKPLDLNSFLDMISMFPNLTWLSYRHYPNPFTMFLTPPVTEGRSPVVLPNLQVLWCNFDSHFEYPFKHIVLPSLRYLSIHLGNLAVPVPLIDLFLTYCQTIQSIVIRTYMKKDEIL